MRPTPTSHNSHKSAHKYQLLLYHSKKKAIDICIIQHDNHSNKAINICILYNACNILTNQVAPLQVSKSLVYKSSPRPTNLYTSQQVYKSSLRQTDLYTLEFVLSRPTQRDGSNRSLSSMISRHLHSMGGAIEMPSRHIGERQLCTQLVKKYRRRDGRQFDLVRDGDLQFLCEVLKRNGGPRYENGADKLDECDSSSGSTTVRVVGSQHSSLLQ